MRKRKQWCKRYMGSWDKRIERLFFFSPRQSVTATAKVWAPNLKVG